MPHRAATLMARSTPFSGAIRPSTARYSGLTGCGVNKFSGSPWWIVRIQLACGTGRRWEFEMEITGTLEKVVNTGWCSGKSSLPCSVVTKGVGCRENDEKG